MNATRTLSFALLTALGLAGAPGSAAAQDPLAPPTTTSAPAPTHASSSGGDKGVGLGIGVAAMLSGPSGISFAYEAGPWFADALLAVAGNGGTDFALAGRGWFKLHSTAAADFSVGGGIGFTHGSNPGPAPDVDILHIEAGVMIRAFIASNVSLNAFAGLAVLAADGDGDFFIDGQQVGALGITYFFF
jgi:hypothetical protein